MSTLRSGAFLRIGVQTSSPVLVAPAGIPELSRMMLLDGDRYVAGGVIQSVSFHREFKVTIGSISTAQVIPGSMAPYSFSSGRSDVSSSISNIANPSEGHLRGLQVLYLHGTEIRQEIDAILTFVKRGGTVVVSAGECDATAPLCSKFGISWKERGPN